MIVDYDRSVALELTHDAILDFARVEFRSLARKAVYRLQRISASGIYGDDYRYRTLWDEYCHEVQEGPHELLEGAWDLTLLPLLDDIVGKVPHQSAILLSIAAASELGEEDAGHAGAVWPEGIRSMVRDRLRDLASWRKLERFQDW